ncbi:glycoside hydrolase family 3 C-terminal domain-containing protein [Streptomyces sp. NPDC002920]
MPLPCRMVLLRNVGGVLPLAADSTVALIGPGARDPRAQGGGSVTVFTRDTVTPEQGLRAAVGGRMTQADGVHLRSGLRPLRRDETTEATLTWFAADGSVLETAPTETAVIVRCPATVPEGSVAVELRARVRVSEPGTWRFGAFGVGRVDVSLDGGPHATSTTTAEFFDLQRVVFDPPQASMADSVRTGEDITLTMRYTWLEGAPVFRAGLAVQEPRRDEDEEFAHAVATARRADVAVVVVGTTEAIEQEGHDREHLRLPGRQDELVSAVAAANPRTVVVVNSGAPVLMPWRDDVSAILLSWFPGTEFGNALADVLTGVVEPGGRLPTTWPLDDVPVDDVTPLDGVLNYTEGVHIGHRAFLRADKEPAYWFGAGEGYTSWEYEGLTVDTRSARVAMRNAGERPGKQVVQVYLSRPDSSVERPARWLAGFTTVHAAPGERLEVDVEIAERALQHWTEQGWATEPGAFRVQLGPSAGDIVAEAELFVG